jgi:hypothetical protein
MLVLLFAWQARGGVHGWLAGHCMHSWRVLLLLCVGWSVVRVW